MLEDGWKLEPMHKNMAPARTTYVLHEATDEVGRWLDADFCRRWRGGQGYSIIATRDPAGPEPVHDIVVNIATPFAGRMRMSSRSSASLFGSLGIAYESWRRHRRKMRQVVKLVATSEVVVLQETCGGPADLGEIGHWIPSASCRGSFLHDGRGGEVVALLSARFRYSLAHRGCRPATPTSC